MIAAFMVCAGFITSRTNKILRDTRWVVTENSSLRVLGSTNVHKFSCDIVGYNKADTITVRDMTQLVRLTGSVNLEVSNFNCHNIMMTKQLRKTLKATDYPTLCIDFISLSGMPRFKLEADILQGVVEIHLAGKSKRYLVDYVLSTDADKTFQLHGRREINFSDFDLTAPKKVGGMVSAKDKLLVDFNLHLKILM